jgi:20S proteasome alpha/beta subunit
MRPLAIKVIVAGWNPDGSTFLAATDLYGTSWSDDAIGTSISRYMQGLQIADAANGDREKVLEAMNDVWKGLYARDILQRGPLEYWELTDGKIKQLEDVVIQIDWVGRTQIWGDDLVK